MTRSRSGVKESSVKVYVQGNPAIPLIVDGDNDANNTCDGINIVDQTVTLNFANVESKGAQKLVTEGTTPYDSSLVPALRIPECPAGTDPCLPATIGNELYDTCRAQPATTPPPLLCTEDTGDERTSCVTPTKATWKA